MEMKLNENGKLELDCGKEGHWIGDCECPEESCDECGSTDICSRWKHQDKMCINCCECDDCACESGGENLNDDCPTDSEEDIAITMACDMNL
tara:strand:- start:933 stop:1208 length:276 start_codon:yes stop_codon:yes gene_type:complete